MVWFRTCFRFSLTFFLLLQLPYVCKKFHMLLGHNCSYASIPHFFASISRTNFTFALKWFLVSPCHFNSPSTIIFKWVCRGSAFDRATNTLISPRSALMISRFFLCRRTKKDGSSFISRRTHRLTELILWLQHLSCAASRLPNLQQSCEKI